MEIEKAFKRLLIQQPFYGIFCLSLPKSTTTEIPTLAVAKKGLYPELLINPEYWGTLSDDQQIAVLQHELSHIALQHIFMSDFFEDKKLFNVAADLEVNSYIQNLPEHCLFAKNYGFENGKGSKYYYDQLMQNAQKTSGGNQSDDNNQSGDNSENGLIGDHSHWSDFKNLSEASKQLIQSNINTLLKNTAEQVSKQRGTIPGELSEIIQKLQNPKPEVFNWKSYFRRMLGSIYDINVKSTRKRPSKRFEESSGIKHKKKVSILVAVDTSGSVSTNELEEFFNEINYIYKAGARVTIIQCDTQINSVSEYDGKTLPEIKGRGGTDFNPPVEYYLKKKRDYESLIYFTDGGAPLPHKTASGMVWIITSNGDHQDYPGKAIYIPKDH